ncbi:MAG TPA: dolichyl-phosphate beta-glucosyltransferase [Candidatus Paceibacterota bacterium]|nr:dolichyl-phosphate beta-glucosyltransferase [Candidatus Paceibacterota bacterium]
MAETKLSVIIPAYNEESRLPKTLQAVYAYFQKQNYVYEILVVSDGSKDHTVEVAQEMAQKIPGLRVIAEQENRGKGYAVRKGILEAKGEYRVFTDADNSTSIEHVERMWIEFKKGAEVVIGSRDIKGAKRTVRQSLVREKLGDIFNLMVQMLSGLWGIWDTQCGFKGFSAKAAQEIFAKTTVNRWAFDVEVLVIAKKLGYPIQEIPVVWVNDAESKVRFSGMLKMLVEVLQISIGKVLGKYNG